MKKLALLLFGLGSMFCLSINAADTYSSPTSEPQYQEQCINENCSTQQTANQLPLAQEPCTPCAPDTVCSPAPCNPVPCNNPEPCTPAPCNPGC